MRTERIAAAGMSIEAARAVTGGNDADLSITATGSSSQANSYAIRASINLVTAGGANTGVRLGYENAGDEYRIFNNKGTDLLIYPPTGGTINGGSVNAAMTLADKKVAVIQAVDNNDFWAVSMSITATELAYLDGITPGTVTASKAVVVDANKDIGDFRNVTVGGTLGVTGAVTLGGALAIPTVDPSTDDAIANYGLTTIGSTSGAVAYSLDAPAAGLLKILACTEGSTANTVVVTATGATFDGTNDIATFNAAAENLSLIGLSTALWAITGNVGAVALTAST